MIQFHLFPFRATLLFISFLFSLTTSIIFAQNEIPDDDKYNYVYRNWNSERGLPQNTVYALATDKSGYLWGATEEGLFKFDGAEFTVINDNNTPGLLSNTFYDLISSGDDLWASSRNSLIRFYNNVKYITDFSKFLAGGWISNIEKDKAGRIWVGTSNGNLFYIQDDSIRKCRKWNPEAARSIEKLKFSGNKMIIGTSKGLFTMTDPESESIPIPQFKGIFITAIAAGTQDKLWIGTANMGLYHFNGDTVHYMEKDGLRESYVTSLYFDDDKRLWIGLRSAGYQVFENNKFITPPQSDFSNDGIRAILTTPQFVWMGTNSSGLLQVKPALIKVPAPELEVKGKIILAVYQHSNGEIWTGTAGRGVHRYFEGKLTKFTQQNGLSNNLVLSIYGKDEFIYIGTTNGLDRFNRNTGKIDKNYTQKDGLRNNGVLCIFNDSQNRLWIATRMGGLHQMMPDGSIVPFDLPGTLGQTNLLSAFEDSKKNIWFGSRGAGLFTINVAGKITQYQVKEGFPADIAYGFYEDSESDIWITTEKGLVVYYKGIFKLFTKESGLLANENYRILADTEGYVWLSGNLGLQRIAVSELLTSKKTSAQHPDLAVRLFNALDGMPKSETNGGFFPAGWAMKDGTMWFPTGQGVAIADPQLVGDEDNNLNIYIQSLRYGNNEFFPEERIELPPGINNFEIRYTSIDFAKANEIQFFFRLKGLNKEWTPAGNRRVAYFSVLEPGNYTFEVRAERYGENSQTATLHFTVNPHFYQTSMFKALMVLGGLLIIAGVIFSGRKAARRKLKAQQQITRAQIRGQEKERQFISAELHDSINQQLSTAKIYLDFARTNETMREELITKSENVLKGVVTEINALCNSLTPPSLKDIGLKETIGDLLTSYTSVGKFVTVFDFNLDITKIEEDLQFILFRITQEQINNIARHSEAKTIWLDFRSTPTNIHISIKDDGKGFELKNQGLGMGFENIRNRLSIYEGKMEIKSSPGKGCTVIYNIPVRER